MKKATKYVISILNLQLKQCRIELLIIAQFEAENDRVIRVEAAGQARDWHAKRSGESPSKLIILKLGKLQQLL